MRALTYDGSQLLLERDRPVPTPGPEEALIRVTVPAYRRPVTGTIIFGALLFAGGLGGAINWTILGPVFLIAIGVLLLLQSVLRRR